MRKKVVPPLESRMVVYVRQENEEIYTPLHLVPPTVPGLARAIESKYNVSATAIRSTINFHQHLLLMFISSHLQVPV